MAKGGRKGGDRVFFEVGGKQDRKGRILVRLKRVNRNKGNGSDKTSALVTVILQRLA